jgi:hypothetical protein
VGLEKVYQGKPEGAKPQKHKCHQKKYGIKKDTERVSSPGLQEYIYIPENKTNEKHSSSDADHMTEKIKSSKYGQSHPYI